MNYLPFAFILLCVLILAAFLLLLCRLYYKLFIQPHRKRINNTSAITRQ